MSHTVLFDLNVDIARKDILDPSKTIHIVRGFLDKDTLGEYFDELKAVFDSAPRIKDKPEHDDGPDCVQPWIYDHDRKQFMVHRIYSFIHNEQGTLRGRVHEAIMQGRDQIESVWPNKAVYEEKNYSNFHIVTKYEDGGDGYPRHTDVPYEYDYPMLQCWVQLSEHGKDFTGGDLILYTPDGGRVSGIHDLGIQAGDLVFFDKRTEHEVSPCHTLEGGEGRWIVIVGAMGPLKPR